MFRVTQEVTNIRNRLKLFFVLFSSLQNFKFKKKILGKKQIFH